MSNPLKISVITVCLNSARTIGAAIRSVLSQNYPELEYIVVDGGSADGTMDIVRQYGDNIAKVISEPDCGIYDAINKGVALSTGDIVGVLNADDLYAPWTFSTVRQAVENNPGYGVYMGHTLILDEHVNRCWVAYVDEDWVKKFKLRMAFSHQSAFITKETYALHGSYSLEYALASDWDYFLKLHEAEVKFLRIDSVLAAFRHGGATTAMRAELLSEMLQIANCHNTDMAAMGKYYKAGIRSYYRAKWKEKMGLTKLLFRLRELTGTIKSLGKWTPSMEQQVFTDYLLR